MRIQSLKVIRITEDVKLEVEQDRIQLQKMLN